MSTGLPFLGPGDIPDCSTTDPEAFFPPPGSNHGKLAARVVCHGCPFLSDCAEYGIKHDYLFGIWGGMAQLQRTEIRKARGWPSLYRPLTLSTVIPGFDDDNEDVTELELEEEGAA